METLVAQMREKLQN